MTFSIQAFPWKRMVMVGLPFWLSKHKWKAAGLLGGAIFCVIAKLAINVQINDTNGEVWSALKAGPEHIADFHHYLMLYFGLVFLLMPFEVLGNMSKTWLGIIWRQFLSNEYFGAYFAGLAALKLEQFNAGRSENEQLDNPEWRMTAEVDQAINKFIEVTFELLNAVMTVVTMGIVLWGMSLMLTGIDIVYAVIGWVLAALLGAALSALQGRQQKTEGDLRSGLTEARNQADIMVAYRGQEITQELANHRQNRVIDTLLSIMKVNRNMQVFTALYYPLAPLIPLALMGELYLHDPTLNFGVIAKAQSTFNAMFIGMAVLVGQFTGISLLRALINRLGELMEFLQAAGAERLPEGKFIRVESGAKIAFRDLTVTTDSGTVLVANLTLEHDLQAGEGILMRGPQATARSALLKAVVDVWPYGTGSIVRPQRADVSYVSPQPFMQPMTLREALCYPSADNTNSDDARLAEILKLADLGDLLDPEKMKLQLDSEYDWRKVLTPSKQQRLAIARIINKKPRYVLIDEAANAMEAENRKLLITIIKTLGLKFIIANNATDLLESVSWVLEIADDGSCKLLPAHDYQPTSWRKLEQFFSSLIGAKEAGES